MSFAAFERLPHRLGWKHEYYDGQAHITPAKLSVAVLLDLAPRPRVRRAGLRLLRVDDAESLRAPFLAAFSCVPDYAGYPARHFRRAAARYIEGFFGDVRGMWSPISVVAEADGRAIGAALVKCGRDIPLLDCLFVSPEYGRKGWGTALVTRVVQGLLVEGESRLLSYVHLANEASLAWHLRFGFQEVPDLWVATHRWRHYEYELERHRRLNDCSEEELRRLAREAEHWRNEMERLTKLEKQDFWTAHPRFH